MPNSQPSQQDMVVEWLTSYRDKWWTRGWVSSDRKQIVSDLLGKLKPNATPEDILKHISSARQEILANDIKHKRTLTAGLSGRLYQFLGEVETRVRAASDAATLDKGVKNEFAEIKGVLSGYATRFELPKRVLDDIDTIEVEKLIDNGALQRAEFVKQYKQISSLLDFIPTLIGDKDQQYSEDFMTIYRYCQQKKSQLVYYFAQCEELKTLNEPRSIQVYHAASEAGSVMVREALSHRLEGAFALPKTVKYRDDNVAFRIIAPTAVTSDNPFFRQINNEKNYHALLYAIERSIVERASNNPQIQFEELYLDESDFYGRDGFKLRVTMLIDGVRAEVDYHFNKNTEAVYCDNHTLTNLDAPLEKEPKLPNPLDLKESKAIDEELKALKEKGQAITEEIDKIEANRAQVGASKEMKKRLAECKAEGKVENEKPSSIKLDFSHLGR
jgi:hypothetical protein